MRHAARIATAIATGVRMVACGRPTVHGRLLRSDQHSFDYTHGCRWQGPAGYEPAGPLRWRDSGTQATTSCHRPPGKQRRTPRRTRDALAEFRIRSRSGSARPPSRPPGMAPAPDTAEAEPAEGVRADLGPRAVGFDPEPGGSVHLPAHQDLTCLEEDLVPVTDPGALLHAVIPGRRQLRSGGRADSVVAEPAVSEILQLHRPIRYLVVRLVVRSSFSALKRASAFAVSHFTATPAGVWRLLVEMGTVRVTPPLPPATAFMPRAK
jgi:hypothetical protein